MGFDMVSFLKTDNDNDIHEMFLFLPRTCVVLAHGHV